MCWPVIAAAALTAASAYQQANARKASSEYQAQVANNNAQVANWQAQDAKERGDVNAANLRRKYASLQGTQEATLAARGLDISEGSANAILTDTDFFGDYDQRLARSNSQREAYGFRVRAGNFTGDAGSYSAAANADNPFGSAVTAGAGSYFGGMSRMGGRDNMPRDNMPRYTNLPYANDSLLWDGNTVADRWYT